MFDAALAVSNVEYDGLHLKKPETIAANYFASLTK